MQRSKRAVYMIDQSDAWRFDIESAARDYQNDHNTGHGQMFRKNVRFKQARLGKKCVVLKKPNSEKIRQTKYNFFVFFSN